MRHEFQRIALMLAPLAAAGLVAMGAPRSTEPAVAKTDTQVMQAQYLACRDQQTGNTVALSRADTGPRTQRPEWLMVREAEFMRCLQAGLPTARQVAAR